MIIFLHNFHFTGLNFGKIKNFIHQCKKCLAGTFNIMCIRDDIFFAALPKDHLIHPNDRIDGRTDFMGHIGKEIILGTIGFFRCFLGGTQLLTLLCLLLCTKQIKKSDSEKDQQKPEHPEDQHKDIRDAFCHHILRHITDNIKFRLLYLRHKQEPIIAKYCRRGRIIHFLFNLPEGLLCLIICQELPGFFLRQRMDDLSAFCSNHHIPASVVIVHHHIVVDHLRVKTFIQYIFDILSAVNRHRKEHSLIFAVAYSVIPPKGFLHSGKLFIVNRLSVNDTAAHCQNAVLYLIPGNSERSFHAFKALFIQFLPLDIGR